jgi:hypothetical protein
MKNTVKDNIHSRASRMKKYASSIRSKVTSKKIHHVHDKPGRMDKYADILKAKAVSKISHHAHNEDVVKSDAKTKSIRIGSISTPIDDIFRYIEEHSPIKESMIPHKLRNFRDFEDHINLLESRGMIEIQFRLLSNDRIFVFKTRELQKYLTGACTI